LGLRGLFAEARQAGDISAARDLAERALKLNPSLGWASSAMLAIQSANGDWPAAIATLEARRKSGQTTSEETGGKRAILLCAQAMATEARERGRALAIALEAHRLDPGLVPAALVAARLYSHQGSQRKVWKVVSRTWAKRPHPGLALSYAYARPGDSPQIRFERVRQLVNSHKGGIEGVYALARAAIEARQWTEARKLLDPVIAAGEPQARFCSLMADLEDGELGDRGKARQWLARAVRAPRDPMWVIDGVAVPQWSPLSPVTGEIAEAEWKVPYTLLPGEATPLPEPPPPPESEAEPEPVVEPEPPPRIEQPKPAAEPPPPPPPAPESFPRPVMVTPVRPPDDPGPQHGDHFTGTNPTLARS
jgi:HemY protein